VADTHELSDIKGVSAQQNKASKRVALTNCRVQREEQVRTEIKPVGEGHSLSVEHSGRDESGQGKEANDQGALTNYRARRGVKSGQSKGASEAHSLSVDHRVITAKDTQQARGTHVLSIAERETSLVSE
jgi:hypothetical protein